MYQPEGDKDPSLGSTMCTSFVGMLTLMIASTVTNAASTEKPAMIDYIWTSEELTTTSLLSLPEELLLPNFYLSSDHVALLASLAI